MDIPKKVKLVEVGPRDGLQNETTIVPADIKIELINRLSTTGLKYIEATSFVSPEWVPQMADNEEVLRRIQRNPNISYSALVPNEHGIKQAIDTGLTEIGVFTSASETFCQKNINCSIEESLNRFAVVIEQAARHQIKVRAYVSCVLGCPYEGKIDINKVASLAIKLIEMGCYEVSLGDTIGVGTAGESQQLISTCSANIPLDKLAVHYHDTYGQALTNIFAAMEKGIHIIDSSVAGLGGCPYAKGASGNIASEDVLYMLNGLGIKTGVDLDRLIDAGNYICDYLERKSGSKVALAT